MSFRSKTTRRKSDEKEKKEKDKGKQTTTTTKATKATKAAVVCFCHTTKEHGIVGQKGRAKNKKTPGTGTKAEARRRAVADLDGVHACGLLWNWMVCGSLQSAHC